VAATQRKQGENAVARDLLRREKQGRTTAVQLQMRVLVRTRKLKMGGGPQVDVWSTKGIVTQLRNDTKSKVLRAKVRWLTHGHGEAAVPGTTSRWLLASRDLREDESLTAVAHVESIGDALARRDDQARGVGSIDTGLRIAIPKNEFFNSKRAQSDYFGKVHEAATVWGRVGRRSSDGRNWSVFTDFGCLDLSVGKVRQLAEATMRGEHNNTNHDEDMDMNHDEDMEMSVHAAANANTRRMRKKRKRCSKQFQFFAKSKKPAIAKSKKPAIVNPSAAAANGVGIQLWPWDANSCHLDTFLACIVSVLSRSRTLGTQLPSTEIAEDDDPSVQLARGYFETAQAAIHDYEQADYGRSHHLVRSILNIDRDHFREKLKTEEAQIECPSGRGDWREHHVLLSRPATKASVTPATNEAFSTDFALQMTSNTWCIRRRVPSDSPLLLDLPPNIDKTKFGVGNPACRSRTPTSTPIKTTNVIMLDGHRFNPPLPLPGTPEYTVKEFIAPQIRNLLALPSTRLDTTENALRQSIFGGSYAGACQTPDSTSEDAQQCAGATFVLPDIESR
jgi:hypothetical protein